MNELNELSLLRLKIFEESGDIRKGIKFAIKFKHYIVDDIRRNEALARLYMANNQTKKAIEHLEILVKYNSCNTEYYKQILIANGIDLSKPENSDQINEILSKYEEVQPKSNSHIRLALDLLPAGIEFKTKLIKYMRPMVIKGVPSLINDIKNLYTDSAKAKIIEEILLSMCSSMETEMVLDPADEEEQDPTSQLWIYYFLSQHHLNLAQVEEALVWINKAIEHTPTVVELYLQKGKIF